MGVMELIYLLVGVGLGFFASRMTGSRKQPQVSIAPSPQAESRGNVELESAVSQAVANENLQLESAAPSPQAESRSNVELESAASQAVANENLASLAEDLKQTQIAYEMAKQISQFKSGFLARASHELRSPLTSLIGMHQLILSDLCDSPEEEREFVAQANVSALKMVKLLTDVIDVSKIEHGKASLEITALPVSKVLENLHTLTYMQAAHSNLQFEVITPLAEIYVFADPRRFQQVLVGIVDTAITWMESGSIRVSAASSPESNQAQIWIDVAASTPVWSEAVDLITQSPEVPIPGATSAEVSPGMNLLMIQTVVEVMHGRLELVAVSDQASKEQTATDYFVTRLQCSLPLVTPEPVVPASV